MSKASTRAYRAGVLVEEDFPVAAVSDFLEEPDTIVWVDLVGPSTQELLDLAEELGLHELAVEDAVGRQQRPKLDRYPTHLFLTTYHVTVDLDAARLDETEVNAFFNNRWLITVRKDDGVPMDRVIARWDRSPALMQHGVGFLLYGLLDVIVDDYFAVLSELDDFYERVSDLIFAERPLEPSRQRHWFEMRRVMVAFHRRVVPMRETVSTLMRHEQDIVPEGLYPYFQDVYDHILRVSESSDSLPRPGHRHRGDELQPPGLPTESDRQEGLRLGGDHRGPGIDHRVLRDECPLPRVRRCVRRDLGNVADHRGVGRSVLHLQAQRLAVAKGTFRAFGPPLPMSLRS